MKLAIAKQVTVRLPRHQLEKLLRAALRLNKITKELSQSEELSLVLVGEKEMKRLNGAYRNKHEVTDVLSFDYGEIIICVPVAVRQAKEHKVGLWQELQLLFVHGLLHVLGYDHIKPKDNKVMRAAETKLLGFNGLVDRAEPSSKKLTKLKS